MPPLKPQDLIKMITRLSKREKAIFYAAATIVTLLLLDRLIVYPVYSKIASLNNEIRSRESGIVRDLHIISQKDRIANEAKQYASYISSSQSEEEEMTSFLKEIENLANKSSLYIVDMKPAGFKEEKDSARKYLVNVSCEGQMEQIMDFMYNIENSSLLLGIEKYQVGQKSKESSIAQSTMTISKIVLP